MPFARRREIAAAGGAVSRTWPVRQHRVSAPTTPLAHSVKSRARYTLRSSRGRRAACQQPRPVKQPIVARNRGSGPVPPHFGPLPFSPGRPEQYHRPVGRDAELRTRTGVRRPFPEAYLEGRLATTRGPARRLGILPSARRLGCADRPSRSPSRARAVPSRGITRRRARTDSGMPVSRLH